MQRYLNRLNAFMAVEMEECLYTAAGDKGHCSEAKILFSYDHVGGFRTCGLPSGSTCRGVSGRLPDKIIKGYSLVIASTPSFGWHFCY